ncbi:CDP-glycerol glycerophosphotransferase family protein [Vibrio paucivorans]
MINFILNLLRYSRKIVGGIAVNVWARFIRIESNKVLFNSFQGVYCCNPRAISDELLRNFPKDVEIIWVVRDDKNNGIPDEVNTVLIGSFSYYYHLASSKIIVENTIGLQRSPYRKKRLQVVYQTWHGSLGIKRLDGPIVNGMRWKIRRWLAKNETNYCISNSTFETNVFQGAYWPGVKTLTFGHARNDLLFPQNKSVVKHRGDRIKKNLNIEGKRTVLIAPSHYDGESNPLLDYNFPAIAQAFGERFGGEWVVLFRLHPRYINSELDRSIDSSSDVVNVTSVFDMQDLLFIADCGITDFSSWIFDFLLTNKPGFILHQDKDFINYKRGLYFPFESTPFPISSSVSELIENVHKFDEGSYRNKTGEFLEDKGCIEDGEASSRIANHIINQMR